MATRFAAAVPTCLALVHAADVRGQVRPEPPIRLTRDGLEQERPRWTPDGPGVTFVSDRNGGPDLYTRTL